MNPWIRKPRHKVRMRVLAEPPSLGGLESNDCKSPASLDQLPWSRLRRGSLFMEPAAEPGCDFALSPGNDPSDLVNKEQSLP